MQQVILDSVWKKYCELYATFTPSFQRDLLEKTARHCSGYVVDAGVGVGKMLEYYDSNLNVSGVVGVDSSNDMLGIAKKFNSRRGLEIILKNGDVRTFESYDIADTVVSLNVLYALRDPIEYLNFLSSSMKENSTLVMSSQNRDLDLKKVQNALDEEFSGDDFEKFKQIQSDLSVTSTLSTRRFSLEEMVSLFKISGFEVIDLDSQTYLGSNFFIVGKRRR
ncbi:MAG: methyltransferase domain-containing protein [Nanoarchaeota archaeon]|nr:methyltransferase domain-containing protein [Nanoarchaeota archaeon]